MANAPDPKDSKAFNVVLIQTVKGRIALYDQQHALYKNNDVRIKLWEGIGEELGMNTESLRTRWKTLRDRFKKEWRKEENNLPIIWAHYNDMAFLKPYLKNKESLPTSTSAPTTTATARPNNADDLPFQSHLLHSTNNYILELAMNSINGSGHHQPVAVYAHPPPHQSGGRKRQAAPSLYHLQAIGGGGGGGGDGLELNNNEMEEDELFCRLMLKKLKRMDEPTRERAKAKMIELLVQVLYPPLPHGS